MRAVVSLLIGLLLGVGALLWFQSQKADPAVGSMIAGFERQNKLTVFAAQIVPVVTSRDEGIIDLLDAEQTAIIPAAVNYTVDLAQLKASDVTWDAADQRMTITVPPLMIQPPNLFEQNARYYRKGVWVTGTEAETLARRNSAAALKEARRMAQNPQLVSLAKDAGRAAIAQNATAFLRGAGYDDARIAVRFANEAATAD